MRSHPVIVSLATLDIFEGLLYRFMPVLNLAAEDRGELISYPGLATELVQFVFEMAGLNCLDGADRARDDLDLDLFWHSKVLDLEARVEAWQPDTLSESIIGHSVVDATHILTRTRVHKTAILLFIHRLRYPLGQDDATANRLAAGILFDLRLATVTTKEQPQWVTLPFTLAAIEATDPQMREEMLRDVDVYIDSLSAPARDMTKAFLRALWNFRDTSGEFRWMDMLIFCLVSVSISESHWRSHRCRAT